MSAADRSDDVVTVIRLVSLGRADRGDANSGIVTTVGQASIRTEETLSSSSRAMSQRFGV